MTLIRGKLMPFRCLSFVLLHTLSGSVPETESLLGISVTLVRSKPIPFHRLSIVLRYANPGGVIDCEAVLRFDMASVCC